MSIFQQVFAGWAPASHLVIAVISLVLLAMSWRLVARVRQKRALAKRRRNLFYAMAEGVELKVTARPTADEEPGNPGRWCHDVQQWINHTGNMLGQYSAQAAISFRYSPDLPEAHPGVIPGSCVHYESLVLRLNSLRNIIEHPEVYL
jgi:hypothetical protein